MLVCGSPAMAVTWCRPDVADMCCLRGFLWMTPCDDIHANVWILAVFPFPRTGSHRSRPAPGGCAPGADFATWETPRTLRLAFGASLVGPSATSGAAVPTISGGWGWVRGLHSLRAS